MSDTEKTSVEVLDETAAHAEEAAEACGCGCGHDHDHEHHHEHDDEHEHPHHHHDDEDDDECGCGHDHHHHHHDDDDEHEHEHHHHHDEDDDDECGCGHDHHHHDHDDDDEHEHHHHHHDEDDDDECGCGHDHHHDHDDDDEHEHEHHHHHHDEDDDDECGCGHDHHHHDHDDDDECGCGHDHHHEHDHDEHGHHHEHIATGLKTRTYIIEGLDCANCAAKVERKINELEEVEEAVLTYTTKQLRVTAADPDALLDTMRKLADKLEPGVTITPKQRSAGQVQTRTYIIEGLDCANCAAKIERKINELDEVEEATLTYTTKQLRIKAANQDRLLPKLRELADKLEPGVTITPKAAPAGGLKTKVYSIEGLDCANCAAKIERKFNELEEVEEAVLTYATQQLRITAESPDRLLPKLRELADKLEPGVTITEKETSRAAHTEETEKKSGMSSDKKTLLLIGAGAVLFILGEILEHLAISEPLTIAVFVIAYIILGGRVVLTALRNLTKGQIFDENFLMSIATLGAFAIASYPEAVGVMLFYRIGEFFEEKAVERSRTQIMDAVDMRPETVNLVVGDEIQVLPAEEAQIGDVLLVRPGDRIPLDGTVLEGESRIDTSPITGEPVPVHVGVGDEILSGCVNTSGQLKIRAEKLLEESMVTRILDSVENAAASKPKVDRFITKFSRVYTPIVVFLALGTALLPPLIGGGDWNYWIYTALSFLVMSCPCALVLSVPLAFFSGIGAGSKKGILFKGGVALESLADVKAVVMDKTGTITEGNFVLQKVVTTGSVDETRLLTLAASCEQISTHPIANSIVSAAQEKGLELAKPESLEEIAGEGIKAVIGGQTVLCGNRKLMENQGVDLSAYQNDTFGTEVLAAVDGQYAGYMVISDTIKADAKPAIASLKKQNIVTAMLTGDAQNSADAVAKETGIDEVHAKLLPQDKLSTLQKIREKYEHVMFVGDGINDAPVLAGADVGAAMGSGADAAIEAADVVYMTSSMQAIPDSMRIAKAAVRVSWQNIVFALVIKVIVMILGLCGFASMWMAVFADTGVAMLCVLNSVRVLYKK